MTRCVQVAILLCATASLPAHAFEGTDMFPDRVCWRHLESPSYANGCPMYTCNDTVPDQWFDPGVTLTFQLGFENCTKIRADAIAASQAAAKWLEQDKSYQSERIDADDLAVVRGYAKP